MQHMRISITTIVVFIIKLVTARMAHGDAVGGATAMGTALVMVPSVCAADGDDVEAVHGGDDYGSDDDDDEEDDDEGQEGGRGGACVATNER